MPPHLSSSIALFGACLPTVLHGFVVARSHVVGTTTFWTGGAAALPKLLWQEAPPSTSLALSPNPWAIVDHGDVPYATSMIMTSSAASSILTADESGGALDIVKNIALAIVVIGGVLAAVAYLFATYLIPQAAKQLEAQAKEVDPELWREYQRKMEPGESLVMRPDLMQELGVKVREKIIAKFDAAVQERQKEEEEAAKAGSSSSSSSSSGVSSPSSSSNNNDGIMDATIISKEDSRKQD
jgi:hypothetical protein